jgi:hypothetical protein
MVGGPGSLDKEKKQQRSNTRIGSMMLKEEGIESSSAAIRREHR